MLSMLAALIVCAFYNGLTLRRYVVSSDKIDRSSCIRIVEIADLHSHIYGKDQQPLISLIKAQQPDIIALVGDIVDDNDSDTGAWLFFEGIKDIAPVYYVSGNHEYWSGRYDEIRDKVESYGVTVLNNESRQISVNGVRLCISGVDDPELFKYTDDAEYLSIGSEEELFRQRFSDMDGSVFNILLAHRPELIDTYLPYGFDLILSGHTHGGQVRVPLLLNGLFAPSQGWFPKYAGGLYDFDGKTMIVSRGLGFNARVPRIFNPPEVVVVDVTGGE